LAPGWLRLAGRFAVVWLSLPSMSPIVNAAWIGFGTGVVGIISTAVVAIVSSKNSRASNTKTIEAATANTIRALDAARDDKRWDQQRSAYHELSAYLLYVQANRRFDMRDYRLSEEGEEILKRLLGSYKPASWWELQARIAHYGSDDVIAQFEASHDADDQMAALTWRVADLNQRAEGGELLAARKDLATARLRADAIDQALIKRMRAELLGNAGLA
jgi:hypothetical protein